MRVLVVLALALAPQETNPASFEALAGLDSHVQPIVKMRVVGKTLVTLSGDCLKTWDLERKLVVASMADVFAFDVEPAGGAVAVGQKSALKTITWYEVPSLKYRRKVDFDREVGLFHFVGALKLRLGSTVPLMADAKTGKPAAGWAEGLAGNVFPGKELVAVAANDELRIFNHLGREARPIAVKGIVDRGVFDPAGKWFAGLIEGKLHAWSLEDRKDLFATKDHQGVVPDLATNGRYVATAGADKTVKVYDMAAKKMLLSIAHPEAVQAIAFADDKTIVTASTDRSVRLWSVSTGEAAGDLGIPTDFECVAASADRFWFGDQRGSLRVFNPATMAWEGSFKAHQGNVTAIAAGKDRIATVGTDQAVVAWSPQGKEQFRGSISSPDARELRVGPDGAIYGCAGAQVLAWTGGQPKVVYTDAGATIAAFDLSADGKTLGVVDKTGVHFVDLATGKDRASAEKLNPTMAGQVRFTATGDLVYRKEEGTAILMTEKGSDVAKLSTVSNDNPVALTGAFAFHPMGRLATIGGDQVLIWDAAEGKLVTALKLPGKAKALAFSGDGKFLAVVTVAGNAVIFGVKK